MNWFHDAGNQLAGWKIIIPILKSQSSKGGLQQKIKQHKVVDVEQKEQAYKPFKSQ